MHRFCSLLFIAFFALPLQAVAFPQADEGAEAAAWWQPRKPSILILTDDALASDDDFSDELTQDVVRLLQRQLVATGHRVVLPNEVRGLQQRAAALQDAYIGKTETGFERFLCEAAQSDYLIRVGVRVDSEKSAQRRLIVKDRVNWVVSSAQDPDIVGMGEAKGDGRSADDAAAAHEQALASACGNASAGESVVGQLAALIKRQQTEDLEQGRKYFINLQSNVRELNRTILTRDDLRSIDGMNPTVEAPASAPERLSFEVRYKGGLLDLREALTRKLDEKREAFRAETGEDFALVFSTTQRSVDGLMIPRPAEPGTLDGDLIRELEGLARYLYRKNQDWYIGVPVKFQPAHVASGQAQRSAAEDFVRKYWETYEQIRVEHQGIDPLNFTGSVTIDGVPYENLRAAKAEAEKATADYYNSPAGRLATDLAGMTESAFGVVSEEKIEGQIDGDAERDVLFMIKSEMDLYQHEGAIEPESVAFFTRQGTERMVFTRLNRVLDTYRLWVTAVDASNGMKQTSSVELDARLTARLDERLSEKAQR